MIKLKNIVNESPDTLWINDKVAAQWNNPDAIGFAYDEDGKFHVTRPGGTHSDNPKMQHATYFEGRIWKKHKIVSFWEYPKTPADFREIAKRLKAKVKVDILGKDWNIDIENVLIPTRDYGEVVDDIKDVERIPHELSPIEKGKIKRNIPKNWGSKKIPAGLSQTQLHQMQMTSDGIIKLKNIVKESPDEIYLGNGRAGLSIFDDDAYPFYYDLRKRRLYVANIPSDDHFSMQGTKGNEGLGKMIGGYYAKGDPKNEFIYGRLWITHKIMSFWEYPGDSKDMKIVADALSDHFLVKKKKKINIWNDFDVEIYEDEDLEYDSSTYDVDNDYDLDPNEIIPVKSYKRSYNPPDEELQQHLLSPAGKKQIDVPANVGSRRTPSGVSTTQRHQIKSTSEGLNEWADEVTVGEDDEEYMLDFEDEDAIPFGYSNGTMEIGEIGDEHGSANIPNDTPESFAGRLWFNREVISFWIYPNTVAKMKEIVKDLNVTLNNYDEVLPKNVEITDDWKIDVPQFEENHNVFNMFNVNPGDTIQYHIHSDLVPIKDWHPDMISKSKDFKDKLQKQQQMHMLSPIAKSVTDMPNVGSKKTPAGLSVTRRHQMKSTSEIKESPDRVEATKDGREVAFGHGQRDGYVFGYLEDKFYIERDSTHWHMPPVGVQREDYKYPGRVWIDEKIFSFWEYPKDADDLYKVIRDIEKNTEIVVGKNEWYIEVLIDDRSKEIIKNIMNNRGNYDNKLDKTSNAILIPIEKYEGSLDNDINIKHMIIPIMKSMYGVKVPKDWGSRKTPAGLSATQIQQMRSTSEGLKEWADGFMMKGELHDDYDDYDNTIVFGYNNSGDLVYDFGAVHANINIDTGDSALKNNYAGRVWIKEKVIGFWGYPESKEKLKEIISDLNSEVKWLHINNGWKVDIPKPLLSKRYVKITKGNKFDYKYKKAFKHKDEDESVFIPIKDYDISLISKSPEAKRKKRSAMLQHMVSPMYKKTKSIAGIGSRKTPGGLSTAQRHQIKSTSENKD